jgi:hypothetical protein
MYRQGLGDFFLLSLPRPGQLDFQILIDCGVIVGTPNAASVMQGLVKQLAKDVNQHLDIVVVTHRHADHVSGFLQAGDTFKAMTVGEVWVSWVENPDDSVGQQLLQGHEAAETALRATVDRMRATGLGAAADEVGSLLDFRGEATAAGKGSTTLQAVQAAKQLSKGQLRFCRPDDPPQRIAGVGANFYVFGPPRDLKLLAQMDPSKSDPETYGMTAIRALVRDLGPAVQGNSDDAPFDANWTIPLRQDPALPIFFGARYFDADSDWRRIDGSWLEGSTALALAFDQAVNNTSLVLAVELDGGDVLLFAADAQVGNWLSWQSLSWTVSGRGTVTTADLLKHVIFYKVGHHASHNATLAQQGLELMERLQYAMISVNEQMAHAKHWGQMPFPVLLDALSKRTLNRSVRADQDLPPAAQSQVAKGDGYYELTL